ncbi:hypothetical protein [Neisseria sicca]|uniref:hypothetical protein n=1 Tax=Neisseria sicca TaxID=490 RepID=UPI00114D312C|nr:hypothetical protein [Neisseria sicca]MBS5836325.1 hypothetical protein [Neisseria sp.]
MGFAHDFQPKYPNPIISIHSVGKTHATGLAFDTEPTTSRHSRAGGNPFLNFGNCFSSACFLKFPMDSHLRGNDGVGISDLN